MALLSARGQAGRCSVAHCGHTKANTRVVCRASAKGSKQKRKDQQQQQQQQQPSSQEVASTSAAEVPVQPVTREFSALGSKVVESNVPFKGPEDEPDFWEGNQFENFGKTLENYFIPGLIVLGVICGGIAAKTYNEGATTYVKTPTGPDAEPTIIIATPDAEGGLSAPTLLSE
ncbi:hypothetical protein COO60DRAFT_1473359 [Scenedesmus sp. NREL 46B-D3]|nr:hypothetical protein COO60DRAFT_1473359 [Scenedesmus sp. NREL 46B-D3]